MWTLYNSWFKRIPETEKEFPFQGHGGSRDQTESQLTGSNDQSRVSHWPVWFDFSRPGLLWELEYLCSLSWTDEAFLCQERCLNFGESDSRTNSSLSVSSETWHSRAKSTALSVWVHDSSDEKQKMWGHAALCSKASLKRCVSLSVTI